MTAVAQQRPASSPQTEDQLVLLDGATWADYQRLLAIEVEWSRQAIDKLDVYRKLRVPEVWIWHRSTGQLSVYVLRGDTSEVQAKSDALPKLDVVELVSFLDRHRASAAIMGYREALSSSK